MRGFADFLPHKTRGGSESDDEDEMTAYAIDTEARLGYTRSRDAPSSITRTHAHPRCARHNSNICSIASYEDDDVRM